MTSEGWNEYEKAQYLKVFEMFGNVANISFVETLVEGDAEFSVALDLNEMPDDDLGALGAPGTEGGGFGQFNGNAWDRDGGGDLEWGGDAFAALAHETLHGLGLAHPHDFGGSSIKMLGVTESFDDFGKFGLGQGVYTTMSYNGGLSTGGKGAKANLDSLWGYQAGPMALDIAILQQKYGANTTFASGDDVYELPDTNEVGTGWLAIWDTGGTDEIVYNGSKNAIINLNDATLLYEIGGGGFLSRALGVAGGVTIANGVVIENATTGSGKDKLKGNEAGNTLTSNGGRDILRGLDGDDFIFAGAGRDKVIGGADNDTVSLGGGADKFVFRMGHGHDTITDFDISTDHLVFERAMMNGSTRKASLLDGVTIDDGSVTLNFDSGETLHLVGIESTAGLRAAIDFV